MLDYFIGYKFENCKLKPLDEIDLGNEFNNLINNGYSLDNILKL